MASIRRKGEAWEIRFYVGTKRRSKMFRGNLRDARARAAILEGGRQRSHDVTFADVAGTWVAHGGKRGAAAQEAVEARMRNYTLPALGHLSVEKVTPAALEGFYRSLADGGLSRDYIQRFHWDVSGTLRRARRDGLVERVATADVEFPAPAGDRRVRLAPVAEVEALLARIDANPGLAARETALAMRISVSTAARIGEVCGLRWGDVDFTNHAVRVVRNVVEARGLVVVKDTKTRIRRRVAVPEVLCARLAAHREHLHRDYDRFPAGDDDYILVGSPNDEPLRPNVLGMRFRRQRQLAGTGFRFHDLRHLAASMYLADMDVLSASAAVGHRRTSTTTDVYGHLLDAGLDRRTAEAVSKRIDL